MQALGLIETNGLIAAIEAADAMAKSANISIIEKSYVGSGLVTISITGDVGAVKASVEAGVAAVIKLGENFLVSEHVIPRPHEELDNIIGGNNSDDDSQDNASLQSCEDNSETVEETIETISGEILQETESPQCESCENNIEKDEISKNEDCEEQANETQEEIQEQVQDNQEQVEDNQVIEKNDEHQLKNQKEISAYDLEKTSKVSLENLHKSDIDELVNKNGIEKATSTLSKLKVVKLRNLAREYKDFPISGRTITKADKKLLMTKFKLYYEKN